MMKILYLYAEIMGYQMPILKEYVDRYNATVHVVHWDKNIYTPYVPPKIKGVIFFKRSTFKSKSLINHITNFQPDIIYISGWMDKGYLKTVIKFRRKGIPIVCGFDDIWLKTIRQKIASVIFPIFKYFFFSHAWVAGPYQFEYAKRLGFKNNEIIYNCLSADVNIFNNVFQNSFTNRRSNFPHRFLYVGRFEPVKGVDILVKAWTKLINSGQTKDWMLTFIGNGSLINELRNDKSVIIKDFMQPEQLVEEIGNCGCFVLPSRNERWAVVLHEFSAAGMPIICSDICGALPVFVVPNYNGFVFKTLDIDDLSNQMLKIISLKDVDLIKMSENSHKLGQRITPEISASSFMSIIE